MPSIQKSKGSLTVTAYRGDAKTLLAFNLQTNAIKALAGFTIQVDPPTGESFYILNTLRFERPGDHAQDPTLPSNSSLNAPFHKFRWVHVPGLAHQGLVPAFGKYKYTITPRYFESESLRPLDPELSCAVSIEVAPYEKGKVALGFTRGFVQSQAFVRRFGSKATIRPTGGELLFDTTEVAGADAQGNEYSFDEEYNWLGFTAQNHIFEILDEVVADKSLRLDVFAYDLNEPFVVTQFEKLAKQGRLRLILDNAALHHSAKDPKPEDEVEDLLEKARTGTVLRGKFGRYSHDKIFVVRKDNAKLDGKKQPGSAVKVLTGSTNLSVTGLYVNSNHVIVFTEKKIATKYAELFDTCWTSRARLAAFRTSPLATGASSFAGGGLPPIDITFSPHDEEEAASVLVDVTDRIETEAKTKNGSVLFAVMQLDGSPSPVYATLREVHAKETIFSFGISDTTSGIVLHTPKSKRGVLVTGKPGKAQLPKPFSQVPGVGVGHQVHHKFVVCGFNRADAVVYCGSSNLASGGEALNGDNLIAIRDSDIATVFAIEALALVDHFELLNRLAAEQGGDKKANAAKQPDADTSQAAQDAGWFLGTTNKWTEPYYDPNDLRSMDRELFGG